MTRGERERRRRRRMRESVSILYLSIFYLRITFYILLARLRDERFASRPALLRGRGVVPETRSRVLLGRLLRAREPVLHPGETVKFRRDAASAQIGEARLFRRRRRERVLLSVENQDRRRIRGDRAPRQPLVRRVVQNPVERDHAADARAEPRARQVQRAPSAEAKPDDASDAAALRLRLERAHARGDALRGRAPVAPERPERRFARLGVEHALG
mmetsp:Transcript_663/g.2168  ORF Transcript_663/g.2168 Transcript_663/m.2168 type:complete len:215 (-) Transcript_663:451-1095(-)|eukprot:30501-Pelagococcus_subviridis.AAC.2